MSLSAIISGADCGPINPLQGLAKRFDGDGASASQDFFRSGRAGSSREQAFRTQPAPAAAQSLARDASDFFQVSSQVGQSFTATPFDLGSLNAALPHGSPAPAWAAEFAVHNTTPVAVQPPVAASWAGDFLRQHTPEAVSSSSSMLQNEPVPHTPSPAPQKFLQRGPLAMPSISFAPSLPQMIPAFQVQRAAFTPAPQNSSTQQTASWESHFTQLDSQSATVAPETELTADDLATTASLLLNTLQHEQNAKFKNSAFMQLMRQVRDHEVVVDGNDLVVAKADVKGKGKAVDLDVAPIEVSDSGITTARRKSVHFNDPFQVPVATDADFEDTNPTGSQAKAKRTGRTTHMFADQEAEWARLQEDWDTWQATPVGFQEARAQTGYGFTENNPFLNRMRVGADGQKSSTYQSVLEQEAEVLRRPQDAQAWLALGIKQQENEREDKAIQALTRALDLDPTLLDAWLALATSYTNEGNRHEAYRALELWIDNNERYKIFTAKYRLSAKESDPTSFVSMREKREKLVACLIEMATVAPQVGITDVDADVQVALGVLLNTSEDYDKSVDCFRAALESKPDDWVLYNRVGATLANSGRPEEALAYYYRALELNPTYIRARYNLSISCMNIKHYEEAASHMLDALVLQETDASEGPRGITSSSLWDTLKTTCHHLQRPDLVQLCDERDLNGKFQDHCLQGELDLMTSSRIPSGVSRRSTGLRRRKGPAFI